MNPPLKTLQPHQERVIEEKSELDERLKKLTAFSGTDMFETLPLAERERLIRQLNLMEQYSTVLGERIAAF